MRFSSARITNTQKSRGFTLIEMLIIAPIVIIAISGFIGLMVSIVGKVMVTRDQSLMSYDIQDALDRIESDVRLSAKFLVTTDGLPAPQGSNNNFTGTAAFTNSSNTLILNVLATDENPRKATRWLMYYANQPNPCGDTESQNRVFSTKVIYFIKDSTLWRRTYVPDWNLNTSSPDSNTICTAGSSYVPWQQNSCSPGQTAARCKVEDERIMDNITSLNVDYYSTPSSTTTISSGNATSASTINVTITGGKSTAGSAFSTSSSLRVSKLNNIDTEPSALTAPIVSDSQPAPDKVVFGWDAVVNAASYIISYNINGGAWVNTTVGSSTLSYAISASRGDTVTFKIAAANSGTTSNYTTDTSTLPLWTDIPLQANWENYNTGYNPAQFTKTSSCRVFLKGLIRNGTATSGTVVGKLPPGFRPQARLVFQTATSVNVPGRIDIAANGDIAIMSGSTNWISLDTISFIPSSCNYEWHDLPFYNGWSNWGSDSTNGVYENVRATMDDIGRVSIQGLARAGTTTNNTVINQLDDISTSYRPTTGAIHFPAGGNGWSEFWVWPSAGQIAKRGPQTSGYMGLQAFYYPGSIGSWTTPGSLSGNWVNYGTNYASFAFTKASDGVVTIRGIIKNGNTSTPYTLPAAYRPSAHYLFALPSNDNFGRVDILPTGEISLQAYSNTWVALNISYLPQ